jgi:hypothetical protein
MILWKSVNRRVELMGRGQVNIVAVKFWVVAACSVCLRRANPAIQEKSDQ